MGCMSHVLLYPLTKFHMFLDDTSKTPSCESLKLVREVGYTHHLCLCELQAVSIYGRDVRRRHLAGNVTGESIRKVKERDAHCTFFSRLANLTKSRRERSHFRIARAIPQVLRLRIFGRVICECEGWPAQISNPLSKIYISRHLRPVQSTKCPICLSRIG